MTLQASGAISGSNINTELGRSSSSSINFNERTVRQLADSVTGGGNMTPSYSSQLSLSSFYSKSRYRGSVTYPSETGNRNYTGADSDLAWVTNLGDPYLSAGRTTWSAGLYDSQSLDTKLTFENNYMWGDWNFSSASYDFYVSGFNTSLISSISFYCTPFWGFWLGDIQGYGGQLGPTTIYGNGWISMSGAWSWPVSDWVRTYNQISLIAQINHTGASAKLGESYFSITDRSVTLYADIN